MLRGPAGIAGVSLSDHHDSSCIPAEINKDNWPRGAERRNFSRRRGEVGMCDWKQTRDRRREIKTSEEAEQTGGKRKEKKKPHWFSVGMCRLRRTKRLQHLICDILLWELSLSLCVWRSSLATAVHKVWSMAELCHRIVNPADLAAAACPMTNNKHAWPPITMRDARAEQPIGKQT